MSSNEAGYGLQSRERISPKLLGEIVAKRRTVLVALVKSRGMLSLIEEDRSLLHMIPVELYQ